MQGVPHRGGRGRVELAPEDLTTRAAAGTLTQLKGIGDVTARCVAESLAGEAPVYLRRLEATAGLPAGRRRRSAPRRAARRLPYRTPTGPTAARRSSEMAEAARELGHEYLVLTDHSPRLTVASGLTR